ncbi:MAG TPA: hypothetical protein V6D12_03625 [Candidatus Obscuribacterales bacterium]
MFLSKSTADLYRSDSVAMVPTLYIYTFYINWWRSHFSEYSALPLADERRFTLLLR